MVSLGVTDPAELPRARRMVEDEIDAVDAACNRFVSSSDISRCNQSAGDWVPVGGVFLDALDVAVDAAVSTGGLVDPTIGAALVALGYDRDFDELVAACPGPGAAVESGPVAGWRRVEIDRAHGRVRIPAGAALDLGATAKARCVDRAAAAVARLNVGVMVDIGGDLTVAGQVPTGGWRVVVQESSRVAPDARAPVVAVTEGGMASSGTSVRAWRHAGRLVHHIVDPRTGAPARSPWRMVTVAASSCVEANVAATAAVVQGATAVDDLTRHRRPARLVDQHGLVTVVGGWPPDRRPGNPRSDVPHDLGRSTP
jgi:FAD:protein FMN transferase